VEEDWSTASRALRCLTLGSGPLKRTSDRVQFLARILLALCVVAGVPVALTVASVTHADAMTEARAQSAERHQVDAELVADPTAALRAPAVWLGPSGEQHGAMVVVPADARAGSTVPIWVDRYGNRTPRPLNGAAATAQAIGMAAITYVSICALAAGAYLVARALLDRSRVHRWEADWAVTEPQWTRRVP
jgi:hypothetical protein